MKSTKCEACQRGKHEDCDGMIPRGFDEKHDRLCTCVFRDTKVERAYFSDHRAGTTKKEMTSKKFMLALRLLMTIFLTSIMAVAIVETIVHL